MRPRVYWSGSRKPVTWKNVNFTCLVVLAIIFVLPVIPCSAQSKQKPGNTKTEVQDPFTDQASGRFTLDETVQFIRGIAAGTYRNKQRLFFAYRNRKVDFDDNPKNFEILKREGADEEFFSVLKDLASHYTPPPPPPPVTGSVEITCGPPECDIVLGTRALVSTKAGKHVFDAVDPGEVKVIISKAKYASVSRSIKVQPKTRSSETVALEPGPEILAEVAQSWLAKVWAALGSGKRGENLQKIAASGSATLLDVSGKETNWKLSARLGDKTTFDFQTFTGKSPFKMLCDPSPCSMQKISSNPFNKGKVLIDPDEASVLMTQFRRVDLGSMIWRLTAPEVRVISTDLQPSGDRLFHFVGSDETYEMEVGATSTINKVFVKAKFGGDVYHVLFADYVKLPDSAQYPRRTEYRSETNKRVVKVEFAGPVSRPN